MVQLKANVFAKIAEQFSWCSEQHWTTYWKLNNKWMEKVQVYLL